MKSTYDVIRLLLKSNFKWLHDLLSDAIETYRRYFWSDEKCIKRHFKNTIGYELNLSNPQTLNEKIQWLKLNDRTPLHTMCSDKLAVRNYVADTIGAQHLIPLVFTTTEIQKIKPENFPDYPVIIKTNHDNGGVVIVWDETKINWGKVRSRLKNKLKRNYFYRNREWPYLNIKPCIVVEKLLLDENNKIPIDFKVHCFHGKAKMITIDLDRFGQHKQNFYDPDWNILDCRWYFPIGEGIPKPEGLAEMVNLAEKLADNFLYVRVDLYLVNGHTYFGEMTFYHGGGLEKFDFEEWDIKLGDYLNLPNFS